jgi:hypothetical protein
VYKINQRGDKVLLSQEELDSLHGGPLLLEERQHRARQQRSNRYRNEADALYLEYLRKDRRGQGTAEERAALLAQYDAAVDQIQADVPIPTE